MTYIPSVSAPKALTRIIAASDSLEPAKADYTCDGVSDEYEINVAVGDLA